MIRQIYSVSGECRIHAAGFANKVAGGQMNVVNNTNAGYSYVNCRKDPGLDSEVFFTIPNGTEVFPTGKVVFKDGINWYEINLAGAYDYGWVAGNLIGH